MGMSEKSLNLIKCPFCGEDGFDLKGLKSHFLNGDCEQFNNTENISRINWE